MLFRVGADIESLRLSASCLICTTHDTLIYEATVSVGSSPKLAKTEDRLSSRTYAIRVCSRERSKQTMQVLCANNLHQLHTCGVLCVVCFPIVKTHSYQSIQRRTPYLQRATKALLPYTLRYVRRNTTSPPSRPTLASQKQEMNQWWKYLATPIGIIEQK